jgi:hypothetical protein
MNRVFLYSCLLLAFFATNRSALAQQPATGSAETNARTQDPGDEWGKIKKNCPFKHIMGCAEVVFTGDPFHLAVGSIAPQNGIGTGLAYVGHKTTDNWRISWNSDAVASPNASWRAGLYVKFVDTNLPDWIVQKGTKQKDPADTELPEQPVINVYAQTTSLNKLTYFGLGPETSESGRSYYGLTETIFGASAFTRSYGTVHATFYGEMNGRLLDLRPRNGESSPSLEQIYTEASAPGLQKQPFFFEPGVGMRFRPSSKDNRYHLNYDFGYHPFIATSDSRYSFQRFTASLGHQYSIHHTVTRIEEPRTGTGPDECYLDTTAEKPGCPIVTTPKLVGGIGLTLLSTLSFAGSGDTVPFFFQPTLGGSDIQGNPSLLSYQDYRFRAPSTLLLRENFEHSIGKFPVGFMFLADQGSLSIDRGDLTDHWKHSFATGLTLRAGGFPEVYFLFSWGGREGTHTSGSINNTLLGGSTRPSLF